MLRLLIVLVSLAGCAAATPGGEALRHPPPPGYREAAHTNSGGLEHVELFPEGQSASSWQEMVVTETFKGGVEEGDPVRFAQWQAAQWKKDCPSPRIGPVDATGRNGFPAALWRMDCEKRRSTGRPETALTMAIEGTFAFYTVQKAWRSSPTDAEVESWSSGFFPRVRVCDGSPAHPCSIEGR